MELVILPQETKNLMLKPEKEMLLRENTVLSTLMEVSGLLLTQLTLSMDSRLLWSKPHHL